MTLTQKLEDAISLGWSVTFKRNILNLQIQVNKENEKGEIANVVIQELPMVDHFYEERIVGCIDFMINKK